MREPMWDNCNYRVVRKNGKFDIFEVRYNQEGRVIDISLDPVSLASISKEDLALTLKLIELNVCLPVIEFATRKEMI